MWTFLIAGSVYLVGVAIMLYLRPSYMFRPDGAWKEFGIGQREDRYTPFPFWMFCLVWAVVAYVLVILLVPSFDEDIEVVNTPPSSRFFNFAKKTKTPPPKPVNMVSLPEGDGDDMEGVELPKGYYVLNKKATRLSGVPKYVYLGAEEPRAT